MKKLNSVGSFISDPTVTNFLEMLGRLGDASETLSAGQWEKLVKIQAIQKSDYSAGALEFHKSFWRVLAAFDFEIDWYKYDERGDSGSDSQATVAQIGPEGASQLKDLVADWVDSENRARDRADQIVIKHDGVLYFFAEIIELIHAEKGYEELISGGKKISNFLLSLSLGNLSKKTSIQKNKGKLESSDFIWIIKIAELAYPAFFNPEPAEERNTDGANEDCAASKIDNTVFEFCAYFSLLLLRMTAAFCVDNFREKLERIDILKETQVLKNSSFAFGFFSTYQFLSAPCDTYATKEDADLFLSFYTLLGGHQFFPPYAHSAILRWWTKDRGGAEKDETWELSYTTYYAYGESLQATHDPDYKRVLLSLLIGADNVSSFQDCLDKHFNSGWSRTLALEYLRDIAHTGSENGDHKHGYALECVARRLVDEVNESFLRSGFPEAIFFGSDLGDLSDGAPIARYNDYFKSVSTMAVMLHDVHQVQSADNKFFGPIEGTKAFINSGLPFFASVYLSYSLLWLPLREFFSWRRANWKELFEVINHADLKGYAPTTIAMAVRQLAEYASENSYLDLLCTDFLNRHLTLPKKFGEVLDLRERKLERIPLPKWLQSVSGDIQNQYRRLTLALESPDRAKRQWSEIEFYEPNFLAILSLVRQLEAVLKQLFSEFFDLTCRLSSGHSIIGNWPRVSRLRRRIC